MLSVSTKTGDKGQSGLANGQRLGKDELIFEVLGTQDELNSWIGLCIAKLPSTLDVHKQFLFKIQDTLFYIGAELARSPKAQLQKTTLTELEEVSENLQKSMVKDWTSKFIYPGGNEAAAMMDVTRTVSRRLERLIVRLSREQEVSTVILQYINRLSDYFFVLRCFINQEAEYQENKFVAKDSYVENLKSNLQRK